MLSAPGSSFADCFTRLSQIRIWKDGNPNTADGPLVKDVNVFGGCGTPGDAYFGVLPLAAANCKYDVSVKVDLGDRDNGTSRAPRNELHREGQWRDVAIREPKRRDRDLRE